MLQPSASTAEANISPPEEQMAKLSFGMSVHQHERALLDSPCLRQDHSLIRDQGHGDEWCCDEVDRSLETDTKSQVRPERSPAGPRPSRSKLPYYAKNCVFRPAIIPLSDIKPAGQDVVATCSPRRKTAGPSYGTSRPRRASAPPSLRHPYIPPNSTLMTLSRFVSRCLRTIPSW